MESLISFRRSSWLSWFLRGILILGIFFLWTRLFELQIIKGAYYQSLSSGNRVRKVPIVAPRGKILARGGEVLVGNTQVTKRIVFDPSEGFEKVDGSDSDEGTPVSEWVRSYPMEWKFAHVSGYLGQVNKDEVGKVNPMCPEKGHWKMGSFVGRSGLEAEYDCLLSGTDGEELIEVDSHGQPVRILGKKEPVSGLDLKTTIDFGLQTAIADIYQNSYTLRLAGKKGGVIALDPQGEVLALFSSPSFDPNLFVTNGNSDEITHLLGDKNLPLFNRVISGQYHPGSVFKPTVVIAALSEGKIDKDYVFDDPGVIRINNYSYANWYFSQYGGREGKIGVERAIARSTDTFFYKIGELTGIDAIARWAGNFGFGKITGIDLPGEASGLVPSPGWKMDNLNEAWFLGNTYHVSIGQGDLIATPLQIAQETAVIASGGKICGAKIGLNDGTKNNCRDLLINKANLQIVKNGMIQACQTGGTGYTFFDYKPSVACKTGTAEVSENGETHAWFTLFAPADDPQIILTVLVEKGGEGSKVAGPIARKIMDYWIENKNKGI